MDEEEPIDLGDATRYTFDESSGSVALNAEFDYLHGTISDASRVTGVSGNALNFGATSGSHLLFDICCSTISACSGDMPTGLLLEGQAPFPGVIDEFIFSMLEYTPEQIATLAQ